MPVYPTSFFVPAPGSTLPFILEDIYLRGGFRVVADSITRDAIPIAARKPGMLVATADSGKVWQLQSDKITYVEFKSGDDKVMNGVYPISILINGDVSIDTKYLLPQTGAVGDFLVKDNTGVASWQTVKFNGAAGSRFFLDYKFPAQIDSLGVADIELEMSQTIVLLELKTDVPKLKIEAFSRPDRAENNPYTFISTADILTDEGITEMSDGSLQKGRRYSIIANLENPALNKIYWRITNQNPLPVSPTLTFTYLTIQ